MRTLALALLSAASATPALADTYVTMKKNADCPMDTKIFVGESCEEGDCRYTVDIKKLVEPDSVTYALEDCDGNCGRHISFTAKLRHGYGLCKASGLVNDIGWVGALYISLNGGVLRISADAAEMGIFNTPSTYNNQAIFRGMLL